MRIVDSIYNSRNFIKSLNMAQNVEVTTIYNSRNFIKSLNFTVTRFEVSGYTIVEISLSH